MLAIMVAKEALVVAMDSKFWRLKFFCSLVIFDYLGEELEYKNKYEHKPRCLKNIPYRGLFLKIVKNLLSYAKMLEDVS